LPPFLISVDAQQYARLAAPFRGRRPVWVLPHPGFGAGEPVPGTVAALMDWQAAAARQCGGGVPAVLFGHSSGGWAAYAVAIRLAELGSPPAAVIMADSFSWAVRRDA